MSLPREQKKAQMPWFDLAIFAAAVAFLGYSVSAFFAKHEVAHATVAQIEPPLPPQAPDRNPASQAGPSSTEILRLPCFSKGPFKITSSARLAQVFSPLCRHQDQKEMASWKGTNATTGEEILVFVNPKEKTLATSYFTLKEGLNELVFEQDEGNGRIRKAKVLVTELAEDPEDQ